ncbi:MAG: hypothetical protein L3K02_06510, partial [Thermoplasmata archaeon]|nr:hypothetical protein [Thermoplasmata archaeon]
MTDRRVRLLAATLVTLLFVFSSLGLLGVMGNGSAHAGSASSTESPLVSGASAGAWKAPSVTPALRLPNLGANSPTTAPTLS